MHAEHDINRQQWAKWVPKMRAGDEKVNIPQIRELVNSISESTVLGHTYLLLSQAF